MACGSELFDEKLIAESDDIQLNKTYKNKRKMGSRVGKSAQMGRYKSEKRKLRTVPWSKVRQRLRAYVRKPVK